MLSRVYSGAIVGLGAKLVEVEVNVSYGLRRFEIVGLPDKAVEESKERVGSALENSGYSSPHHQPERVLVSLAPADLKKEGSLYDLPIALAYLLTVKKIKFNPEQKLFLGELALDGRLRKVKGVLSLAAMAKEKGIKELILPKENVVEAALISFSDEPENPDESEKKKLKIIGVENLTETIAYLQGEKEIPSFKIKIEEFLKKPEFLFDFAYIKGQEIAKRALEISAAGNHNIFFVGPPGVGKTILAKSIPSILPPLSLNEILEVTKIYSVNGLLSKENPVINVRPFRCPHHTASEIALIGGGTPVQAGEITLAHRGVLFLDEFPEFHRDVLESLRQPIEEGKITLLRAKYHLTLPARFMLAAASNPCPCGNFGNSEKMCVCLTSQISNYRRKLSGPLIDRIDLFINVSQVKYEKLVSVDLENCSQKVQARVEFARKIQEERFKKDKFSVNSEMEIPQIKKFCQVDAKSQTFLKNYVDSGKISSRGFYRILKTARTIADLEGKEKISFDCVSEALMYRIKED